MAREGTQSKRDQIVNRTKVLYAAIAGALTLASGCATDPTSAQKTAVPHAGRVQVALYDTTPRPPSTSAPEISRHDAELRGYQPIATLTINGRAVDEGALYNALAARARELGAQAIIRLPTELPYHHYGEYASQRVSVRELGERVFRCEAIIFTDPASNAPPADAKP